MCIVLSRMFSGRSVSFRRAQQCWTGTHFASSVAVRYRNSSAIGGDVTQEPRAEKLRIYERSRNGTVKEMLESRKEAIANTSDAANRRPMYVAISGDKTVFEAVQRMVEHDIGSLVVLRDEGDSAGVGVDVREDRVNSDSVVSCAVTGIITERDYLRKIVVCGLNSRSVRVAEIMTPAEELVAVTPDTTVYECMSVMTQKQFRHLPVICRTNGLVATISMKDLVQEFAHFHEAQVKYIQEYIHFPIW